MSEQGTNLVSVIERAASNPDVDVDKMERLMQMQERILDRNAAQAFNADMVAAQSKMPKVVSRSRNDQTSSYYAKLDAIIVEGSPVWTEHGFSLSFGEADCPHEGMTRVVCDVRHRDGHCVRYHRDLPLDDKGIKGSINKTLTHASGSTVSYARRYLTCMIFNIATGDDNDGNKPKVEPISSEQALELDAFIDENELDRTKILAWLGSKGVESIEGIPNDGSFELVMKRLKAMV